MVGEYCGSSVVSRSGAAVADEQQSSGSIGSGGRLPACTTSSGLRVATH